MSRAGSTEMKTNWTVSESSPAPTSSRLTCAMSYSVVGQMSGQYMKPKNKNDQRASSDFRSKTPFMSSTSANSANGLRSVKLISAGGRPAAGAAPRAFQSAQYPPATNDSPSTAPTTRNHSEMRCRVAVGGKILALREIKHQSDNAVWPASIMPDTIPPFVGRLVSACITLTGPVYPTYDGANFFR